GDFDLETLLKHVRLLDLRGNNLKTIENLDKFPALEQLMLQGNLIEEIDGLNGREGLNIFL
ncbi:MAG: leucine-rich repeat domain-containing protein, partial [Promethearchaeia archaeon]